MLTSESSLTFKITKTVAVSSLGLYTGLLASSSIVNICSPIDGIKKTLNDIYCKLGETGSALGTLSTTAFAIAYFLNKKPYMLCGLLAAPVSGIYLWATSKAVIFFSQMSNKTGTNVDVELPPNHPSIYNEKGEKLHCPFTEASENETNKTEDSITKLIPIRLLNHISPYFQSMGLHLFISSILAAIPLAKIIYERI